MTQKNKVLANQILKYSALSFGIAFISACGHDRYHQPTISKQNFELNILHINDSHSKLDETTSNLSFPIADGVEENISVSVGGFARVAQLFEQLEQQEKNVIKIHAGDAIVGDLYYRLFQGEAEAKLMNVVCFDSFTLGNHEFDHGDSMLKSFLNYLNDSKNCAEKTKVLSANVSFGKNSDLYQADLVQPYTIIEKSGEKIALIGVTTADKTKNSSRPDADTVFADEVRSVQNVIDELRAKGINKIVVQSHIGYQQDKDLARQLSGVDVIVGGDSHSLLLGDAATVKDLSSAGNYPSIEKNKEGDTVCIVQAWQYSYLVGHLKVNFDPFGKVLDCGGRPHILLGNDFKKVASDQALTEQENDYIQHYIHHQQVFSLIQPSERALQVLEPFRAIKKSYASENIAYASESLCLRRVPGVYRDPIRSALGDVCNKNEFNIQHGGDVQQLVAESYLQQGYVYFKADVSLVNGGGVREDISIGNMDVDKIYRILAFNNTLVQLKLTGREIHAALEDGMEAVLNGHDGSYPYTGGLTWEVDLNQPKGHRVTNLKMRTVDGSSKEFDFEGNYNLITIDFLADGQGSYDIFKTITGERRIEVGLNYTEAFLQYLENVMLKDESTKAVRRLPLSYYSTQKFIDKSL